MSIERERLRLAGATRTLDELDRPLQRRRHRSEIEQARRQVLDLPTSIEESEQALAELPEMVEAERAAKRETMQKAAAGSDRDNSERAQVALRDDARLRGEQTATDPDIRFLEHLGPVPEDPAARGQWVEAAGRVAQHHTLWGVPSGSVLVGPMPPLGNDEYPSTFYAATRAIHGLDRTIGVDRRSLARPGPGLSL
jgi:hypothetical protein